MRLTQVLVRIPVSVVLLLIACGSLSVDFAVQKDACLVLQYTVAHDGLVTCKGCKLLLIQ